MSTAPPDQAEREESDTGSGKSFQLIELGVGVSGGGNEFVQPLPHPSVDALDVLDALDAQPYVFVHKQLAPNIALEAGAGLISSSEPKRR